MSDQVRPGRPVLRRIWPGRGPLVRGSDRVQAASRLVCAAVVLLAVPVALAVGTVAAADAAQRADEQAGSRSQVPAVLLVDVSEDAVRQDALREDTPLPVPTPAWWRGPDGSRRTGDVPAPGQARAGDRVTIWVDRDGHLSDAPLDRAAVLTAGILSGTLTFLCLATAASGGHLGVCTVLDRYRDRQWERGWRSVEPWWAHPGDPPVTHR